MASLLCFVERLISGMRSDSLLSLDDSIIKEVLFPLKKKIREEVW